MTNQEAIASLKTLCHTCKLFPKCAYEKPECFKAIELAISALQTQDFKIRSCDTCKHSPVSKKWPCVDCDMREPADRWEPKEANNSTESSITQKALDTISRQAAITLANSLKDDLPDDERIADIVMAHNEGILEYQTKLSLLPPAQPEIVRCKDCEYGKQDEVGRWFCWSLGCQIGDEDGSGYCANAERRADDQSKR